MKHSCLLPFSLLLVGAGLGKGVIDTQNARGNIVKGCMAGRVYNIVD